MKNKLKYGIIIMAIALGVSGCKSSNNGTTPNPDFNGSSKNTSDAAKTSNETTLAEITDENFSFSGDYNDIFLHEISTDTADSDISIVIDGHQFLVGSDYYVTYFEEIGPAVLVGDQLQYKIKVQDKTFEEVKASDVTEKAVAAGYEIIDGPTTIVADDGFEYIYFVYDTGKEIGAAINMPGPSKEHALGVQIAILDNNVLPENAIAVALVVARTAALTDAENSTAEDISSQYDKLSSIRGARVDTANLKTGELSYSFTVPAGINQTYDSSDDFMAMQFYESTNMEVTVSLTNLSEATDAVSCLTDRISYDDDKSEQKVNTANGSEGVVAYITYRDSSFDTDCVEAMMMIGDKGLYTVEASSEITKLSFNDIEGFFNSDPVSVNKKDEVIIGPYTKVRHDQLYLGEINDIDDAKKLIAEYADMQRERYENPKINDIELSLQKKYDISGVNLGEMDIDTAKDIQKGVEYMYDTYPILKGTLNTLTVANFTGSDLGIVALTQTTDFIRVSQDLETPKVIRNEILLNANTFFNRDMLLQSCKEKTESGYWCKNATDPSKIIVHELGHQLVNVLRAKKTGFVTGNTYLPCVVTDANYDQYVEYEWAGTALRQDVETELVNNAYKTWSATQSGSEEDFRRSISEYAVGVKSDLGISYHETIAEAISDVYCNGKDASMASLLIVEEINKMLK